MAISLGSGAHAATEAVWRYRCLWEGDERNGGQSKLWSESGKRGRADSGDMIDSPYMKALTKLLAEMPAAESENQSFKSKS